jgi:hypothetical protein
MLVDEGAVRFGQPVCAWLSGSKLLDAYLASHLTMRHLLAHRSGPERNEAVWYRSGVGRQELMERLHFRRPGLGLSQDFVVPFQYASDGIVPSLLSTPQDGLPPEVFLRLGSPTTHCRSPEGRISRGPLRDLDIF